MTFFTASLDTIVIRFYLMMGVVIGSFFLGVPWLAALALPMFLTIITGITFFPDKSESNAKVKKMNKAQKQTAA